MNNIFESIDTTANAPVGPKIMNDQEYEEFLDRQYMTFEKKLKELEQKRSQKFPITIEMIK